MGYTYTKNIHYLYEIKISLHILYFIWNPTFRLIGAGGKKDFHKQRWVRGESSSRGSSMVKGWEVGKQVVGGGDCLILYVQVTPTWEGSKLPN